MLFVHEGVCKVIQIKPLPQRALLLRGTVETVSKACRNIHLEDCVTGLVVEIDTDHVKTKE